MSDTELTANTFELDCDVPDSDEDGEHEIIDEDRGEQLAAHYSEIAARQLDLPEGEWWP